MFFSISVLSAGSASSKGKWRKWRRNGLLSFSEQSGWLWLRRWRCCTPAENVRPHYRRWILRRTARGYESDSVSITSCRADDHARRETAISRLYFHLTITAAERVFVNQASRGWLQWVDIIPMRQRDHPARRRPSRFQINSASASSAADASAPSASSTSSVPCSAASNRSSRMLLPLTRKSAF